ncbi:hypothetical protein ES703_45306 [subsurface metagenome]
MGFTLKITNAPPEAVWWMGMFTDLWLEGGGVAMPIDEVWDCPDDPLGHETLKVQLFDVDQNLLYEDVGLGPVNDGGDYTYDYSTGELSEARVALPWLGLLALAGFLGVGTVIALTIAQPRK